MHLKSACIWNTLFEINFRLCCIGKLVVCLSYKHYNCRLPDHHDIVTQLFDGKKPNTQMQTCVVDSEHL